jgi:hypothetical protein
MTKDEIRKAAVKIKALAIELAGLHMFTLSERKEVHS